MGEAGEDGVMKFRTTNLISRLLVVLVVLTASNFTFSQSKYKNGVFLELAGVGGPYSINYERQLHNNIAIRAGFNYSGGYFLIPVSVNKVFGVGKHHFEIGLGLTFYHSESTTGSFSVLYTRGNQPQVINQQLVFNSDNSLFLTSFVGYRYQKPDKRFFYRCGFSPLWRFYNSNPESKAPYQFILWGGMSVGYRF